MFVSRTIIFYVLVPFKTLHKHLSNNCCRQDSPMDVQILAKVWEKIGYLHSLKVSLQDIYYKGKNSNYVESKYLLNWVIKVNFTSNNTYQHMQPLNWSTEKSTSLQWYSCKRKYNLLLIMRTHQTNPNWGSFCNITDQILFKNVKVMKNKESQELS